MTSSNGGLPQAPCPNCGRPVWPSRTHPGAWVDERGATYCRPGTAHLAPGPVPPPSWQHQPAAASGSRNPNRTAWVIVAVITVVAVLGVVAVAISVSSDDSPRPTAAGAPTQSTPPRTTSSAPRFAAIPGGPAPCDPNVPWGVWCFDPATITRDALRTQLQQRLPDWHCWGHDDPTAPDDVDVHGHQGVCQSPHFVDDQYGKWTTEVAWGNFGNQEGEPLQYVTASATLAVIPARGQHGTNNEVNYLADGVMKDAIAAVWPNDRAMGQAIYDAYKPLKANCDRRFDSKPVVTTTGYKVNCLAPIRVTTTTSKGEEVTLLTATARIEAPFSEDEAHEGQQLSSAPSAPTQ